MLKLKFTPKIMKFNPQTSITLSENMQLLLEYYCNQYLCYLQSKKSFLHPQYWDSHGCHQFYASMAGVYYFCTWFYVHLIMYIINTYFSIHTIALQLQSVLGLSLIVCPVCLDDPGSSRVLYLCPWVYRIS